MLLIAFDLCLPATCPPLLSRWRGRRVGKPKACRAGNARRAGQPYGMMEYWSTGVVDRKSAKKLSFYSSPWLCSGQVHPSLPGPDMACRARVPQTPLPKYYSDNSVFQAPRARAGQYSIPPLLQLGRSP